MAIVSSYFLGVTEMELLVEVEPLFLKGCTDRFKGSHNGKLLWGQGMHLVLQVPCLSRVIYGLSCIDSPTQP